MKALLLLFAVILAPPAFAYEDWDSCNSYEYDLAIERGYLNSTTGAEWDLNLGNLLYSQQTGYDELYCQLENSGHQVVAVSETFSRETFEVYIRGSRYEIEFECVRGNNARTHKFRTVERPR